jgi:hypothetical protein
MATKFISSTGNFSIAFFYYNNDQIGRLPRKDLAIEIKIVFSFKASRFHGSSCTDFNMPLRQYPTLRHAFPGQLHDLAGIVL